MGRKTKGYWTKERCAAEAKKYQTKTSFRNDSASAYNIAKKNGWIGDICGHMRSSRKPNGYWTKECCGKEAKKYDKKSDFNKSSHNAYSAAQRNGWLDEICTHMHATRKPRGYWTKVRCKKEALKYPTRIEFLNSSASAFRIAQRNGWLDDICGHMTRSVQPNVYWTKKRCTQEALKYSTRNEFHLSNNAAYRAAQAHGWLNEVCSHMKYVTLPRHYWNKKRCMTEAKKFETRTEFQRGCGGAWGAAQVNGWLDEVCSHMKIVDHGWFHCVYAILNRRLKKAYIGLTRQAFEIRVDQHKSERNTTNSAGITSEKDTEYLQLTPYSYSVDEIGEKEHEYVERYRRLGFDVLNNIYLLGKVGSQTRWTKETCQQEAQRYKTRTEFRLNSPNAYNSAKRYDFLEEICANLEVVRKPNKYWTKERCHQEALKFKTRGEFRADSTAYQRARENGWLDEICYHMTAVRNPLSHWTKIRCSEEASKYSNRSDFAKGSRGAYVVSKENGWLDEICDHMLHETKLKRWTIDICREEALKYLTRSSFKQNSSGAYSVAAKRGWLDEICQHMVSPKKPRGYWTKERCYLVALKYETRSEFQQQAGAAYGAASKQRGWLDDICAHMKSDRVPRGYWNDKTRCAKEALKYPSKYKFKAGSRGAFASARKNGWLDEICQHMS